MADIVFNPEFLEVLVQDMKDLKTEMDSVITKTNQLQTNIPRVYKGMASSGLDESFTPLLAHLNSFSTFCSVAAEYFQYVKETAVAEDTAVAKSMK
ncbi:hypothetical protein EDD66_101389 [Mobilisporobacter senegalensis]|uniref:Uncharacterized protein n=1 Tax=Mobilisporobacter senegalensis TaxID=1329262 RepID=A0A3N1XZV0_9FIRM|nr:hypothetical protein [Mobilisporobacter senegalensis]ROR31771.1 hypothetical protein EDD66_101389 [Mobilisporobacter senegalensis]